MKNTKENRIKYLRKVHQRMLLPVDINGIKDSVEELNSVLSKKRQIVIKEKWSELWSELRLEFRSELWSELWSELRLEFRSELWSELRLEFRSELRPELWSELRLEFRSELWSEFRPELWSELRLEFRSELRPELWSELRLEFRSELWSELRLEYILYDLFWIDFINNFYPELKVFKKTAKKIAAIRSLVKAGNAALWISKTKIYVLPFPEIKIDEKKRLHSETQYACKFLDKETHWLNGVKLEKELWQKIVSKTISAKEAIGLPNAEHRILAMKYIGGENLASELNAKVIGKDSFGEIIELDLKDTQGKNYRYYVAIDPSKNEKVYLRTWPDVVSPTEAMTRAYRLEAFNIKYAPALRT